MLTIMTELQPALILFAKHAEVMDQQETTYAN